MLNPPPFKLESAAMAATGHIASDVFRPKQCCSDEAPVVFLIDTQAGRVTREVRLEGVPKPAQIARYSPDGGLVVVSSLNSNMVSLIDASFGEQAAVTVGSEPMDFAFRGDDLFVGCQGDGSMHIIDIPKRRAKHSFRAGTGCESVGFF